MNANKIIIVTCLIVNQICLHAQLAGDPDSTFNETGIVLTNFAGDEDAINDMMVQSDGKIIAGGYADMGGGITNLDFALARYNTDGSLDMSFGTDGKVTTELGDDEYITSLAIQSDGKIITGGWADNGVFYTDYTLVRYNTDGSLDMSFGSEGIVFLDYEVIINNLEDLALQSDGKIIAVGKTGAYPFYDITLCRLNINGTLDTTFADTGWKKIHFVDYNGTLAVTIQNDDKIIIGAYEISGPARLIRLTENGEFDNSFNGTGIVISPTMKYIKDVAITSDNKIIIAGNTSNVTSDFCLEKYNSDGTLDISFGTDGVVLSDFEGYNDNPESLSIQSNGKIFVAGFQDSGDIFSGTNYDLLAARYLPDGTLDTTFSEDGLLVMNIGTDDNLAMSTDIQDDGRLLMGGYSFNTDGNIDFTIIRLLEGLELGLIVLDNFLIEPIIAPNPIYNIAQLRFELQQPESISLILYSEDGTVQTEFLQQQIMQAGKHNFPINLERLPAGIYYLQILGSAGSITVKILKA